MVLTCDYNQRNMAAECRFRKKILEEIMAQMYADCLKT